MIGHPIVSVIIPTLNEEKNIGRCLEEIESGGRCIFEHLKDFAKKGV